MNSTSYNFQIYYCFGINAMQQIDPISEQTRDRYFERNLVKSGVIFGDESIVTVKMI